MAGPSVTVTREIMADPQVVWRVITDIDRAHQILSAVMQVERLEGEGFVPGVRWREARRFLGREDTRDITVLEAAEPTRAVITAQADGVDYQTTMEIAPNWMGATLTVTFQAAANGSSVGKKVLMATLGRAGMKSAKEAIVQDLDDIARFAEKSARR